jgi:hypothetical protein
MMHVASDVLEVCFKCFIWMLHMLQACVPNVLSVFLDVCCKRVYLYVAKCFIYMLHMFAIVFNLFF